MVLAQAGTGLAKPRFIQTRGLRKVNSLGLSDSLRYVDELFADLRLSSVY